MGYVATVRLFNSTEKGGLPQGTPGRGDFEKVEKFRINLSGASSPRSDHRKNKTNGIILETCICVLSLIKNTVFVCFCISFLVSFW